MITRYPDVTKIENASNCYCNAHLAIYPGSTDGLVLEILLMATNFDFWSSIIQILDFGFLWNSRLAFSRYQT